MCFMENGHREIDTARFGLVICNENLALLGTCYASTKCCQYALPKTHSHLNREF